MTVRRIAQLIRASAVSEGAGVTVHRTLGTPARRQLDPFLMLDHFGSDDNEPIVQHGPFVMNTRDEIETAFSDYRDDRLVQKKARWLAR
jgi:redox-sensitive bicupin YhaK (pirin superfamily)